MKLKSIWRFTGVIFLASLIVLGYTTIFSQSDTFQISLDLDPDTGNRGLVELNIMPDKMFGVQVFTSETVSHEKVSIHADYDSDKMTFKKFLPNGYSMDDAVSIYSLRDWKVVRENNKWMFRLTLPRNSITHNDFGGDKRIAAFLKWLESIRVNGRAMSEDFDGINSVKDYTLVQSVFQLEQSDNSYICFSVSSERQGQTDVEFIFRVIDSETFSSDDVDISACNLVLDTASIPIVSMPIDTSVSGNSLVVTSKGRSSGNFIGTFYFKTTSKLSEPATFTVKKLVMHTDDSAITSTAVCSVSVSWDNVRSADFNGDGRVTAEDFVIFTEYYSSDTREDSRTKEFDLNGDGNIDDIDNNILSASIGSNVNIKPVFTSSDYTRDFSENVEPMYKIGSPISASDKDGDNVVYFVSGEDTDYFDIDLSSGVVLTKYGKRYDYESGNNSYDIVVIVSDCKGGDTKVNVSMSLLDQNEPPVLRPNPTDYDVGDSFVTVHFTGTADEKGKPPVTGYQAEIQKGTVGQWDRSKSISRDESSVRYDNLDNGEDYYVHIRAVNKDGSGPWGRSIKVHPVSDNVPPVFTSVSHAVFYENSHTDDIMKVTASDTDTQDNLNFSVSTGADGDNFAISDEGVLSFSTSPDYESPNDLSVTEPLNRPRNNEYIVFVNVASGTGVRLLTTQDTVKVKVLDWNEVPDIVSDVTLAEATENSFNVSWNLSSSTTIPAVMDYDIRYLKVSTDGSLTSSSPYAGKLVSLYNDMNAPAIRSIGENSLMLIWQPSGNELQHGTPKDYRIRWKSSSESSYPSYTQENGNAYEQSSPYVIKGLACGTDYNVQIRSRYVNNVNGSWKEISGQTEQCGTDYKWQIEEGVELSNSGSRISHTITGLEGGYEYLVQVQSRNDEGKSGWSNSVEGATLSVNNPPVFSSADNRFNVEENTTSVGQITATDTDAQDKVVDYTLGVDLDSEYFKIDSNGIMVFALPPDYENPKDGVSTGESSDNAYVVVVISHSGTGSRALTSEKRYTVRVSDVNEPPSAPEIPLVSNPTINSLKVSWEEPENTGPSIELYDIRAISAKVADKSDVNWLKFSNAWNVENGGSLEYIVSGLASGTLYEIQVRAVNREGNGSWSDSGEGLTETENRSPVFSSNASSFDMYENEVAVSVIRFTDPDEQDRIVAYKIMDVADGHLFNVNVEGILSFNDIADYENPKDREFNKNSYPSKYHSPGSDNVYVVGVSAESGVDDRVLSSYEIFKVTVKDVKEIPSAPKVPVFSDKGLENVTVHWEVPNNTGPSISGYDVRYILSNVPDKSDKNWIIHEDVGSSDSENSSYFVLSDLQVSRSYDVQVRAKNSEGLGSWSDTGVFSTNEDRRPVFETYPRDIAVSENVTDIVHTFSAIDPDEGDDIFGYSVLKNVGDGELFEISSEGALSFKSPPNYESPADKSATYATDTYFYSDSQDNVYILTITVDSGKGDRVQVQSAVVKIEVVDILEYPGEPESVSIVTIVDETVTFNWLPPLENLGTPIIAYDAFYSGYSSTDPSSVNNLIENLIENIWQSHIGGEYSYTISMPSSGVYLLSVLARNTEGGESWATSRAFTINSGIDYDLDDDGLIEVSSIQQLRALQYDLDGNGFADNKSNEINYNSLYSNSRRDRGCPSPSCIGYELKNDIDASAFTGSWTPIGVSRNTNAFRGIFDGNGHVISNLTIDMRSVSRGWTSVGLFGVNNGVIRNVGLTNIAVFGDDDHGDIGTVAGHNMGSIQNSFAVGKVTSAGSRGATGGMVGRNTGSITTSYTDVEVSGKGFSSIVGGMVGSNRGKIISSNSKGDVSSTKYVGSFIGENTSGGSVSLCYAVGEVYSLDSRGAGGFFGTVGSTGTFFENYWDKQTTMNDRVAGIDSGVLPRQLVSAVVGKTTQELVTPNSYGGIYGKWDDLDHNDDGVRDAPWSFLAENSYPELKVDFDNDNVATVSEFGDQSFLGKPVLSSSVTSGSQMTVTWNTPSVKRSIAITGYDMRYLGHGDNLLTGRWQTVPNIWNSGTMSYLGNVPMTGMFYVQVRAKDNNGYGKWSRSVIGHSSELSPTWVNFVQAKMDDTEPILPDFSYAGYRYSTEPIPDVTHREFSVSRYGAIQNDGRSDHLAIQAAIDAASAHGSGVVTFPAGEFLINSNDVYPSQIIINSSNIVLRGSGSEDGGTILRMVNYIRSPDPTKKWANPYGIVFDGSDDSPVLTTLAEDAKRETFWITVRSSSSLRVGMGITLSLIDVQAGRDFMAPLNSHSSWTVIRERGAIVSERHFIAEIQGNRVRLAEPLHTNLKASYGCDIVRYPYIEEVGIEDMSIQGSWLDDFDHHRNDIHNSGWSLIQFKNCRNSWMRRVTIANMSRLAFNNTSAVSAYHIIAGGNPGHYFVRNEGNYGLFFGLAKETTNHGSSHNLNVMASTTGTVYYTIDLVRDAYYDSHSWFPYSNLYDNVSGGLFNGAGGSVGSFPNHLRKLVIWNANHRVSGKTYRMWNSERADAYGQFYVKPIWVGVHGNTPQIYQNRTSDFEVLESLGTRVSPHSLFEAQLALRLGELPAWFEQMKTDWITIKNQTFTPPTIATIQEMGNILLTHPTTASVPVDNLFKVLFSEEGNLVVTSDHGGSSIVRAVDTKDRHGNRFVKLTTYGTGTANIRVTGTVGNYSIGTNFSVTVK